MGRKNRKSEKFSSKRDEYTIRGLQYIPEGKNLPIAIVSHGILANYTTIKAYAKYLSSLGYAAFCFDFNGGCIVGKSNNDTTKMSVYSEAEDLKSVIKYA